MQSSLLQLIHLDIEANSEKNSKEPEYTITGRLKEKKQVFTKTKKKTQLCSVKFQLKNNPCNPHNQY
jgi:hypothetical protein